MGLKLLLPRRLKINLRALTSVRAWSLLTLSCLLLFLVGCPVETPRKNELKLSTISAPKSFNPVTAKETSTTEITGLMFIGLTGIDGKTGEVIPELAQNWQQKQQGRVWIFTLRPDLKWSDGKSLTAADVVFTYKKLYFNPKIETTARFTLQMRGKIPRVEKLSARKIKFTYPRPYVPFPRAATTKIMPRHVFKEMPAAKFNSVWGVETSPTELVVNGPFKLARYSSGQRIILEPNPNYYKNLNSAKDLPRLDQLIFEVVKNTDLQVQKFLRGEIDAIAVQPQHYPIVKPREKKGDFSLIRCGPGLGSLFLAFNMNTDTNSKTGEHYLSEYKLEWFNDRSFRRAVSYGLDRENIREIVYNNLATPRYGPVSPANELFYNPDLKKYRYDPERAKNILVENGYRDRDSDGVREGPNGHPIEFVLLTNSGNDQRVKMSEIIRKDLESLGFSVTFRQVEFNTLVTRLNSSYDWEAVVMGFTGGLEPHFGSNFWLSSADLHLWHPRQDSPRRPWEAQIDRLFHRGVRTVNQGKRKQIYYRWQELVNRIQPVVYTVTGEIIYGIRGRVKGARPTAVGGFTHNIEYIEVK